MNTLVTVVEVVMVRRCLGLYFLCNKQAMNSEASSANRNGQAASVYLQVAVLRFCDTNVERK